METLPDEYLIIPIGDIDDSVLKFAKEVLKAGFGLDFSISTTRYEPPNESFRKEKRIFDAEVLLGYFENQASQNVVIALGIVNRGLKDFTVDELRFGVASRDNIHCICDANWLSQLSDNGHPIFKQRLYKVLMHEIGHTFCKPHCDEDDHCRNQKCLLTNLEGVDDLDQTGLFYCHDCAQTIYGELGVDPSDRRDAIETFIREIKS
jgi:predicted Zn-dependent protease